jgi:hypothetical protein
LATWCAIDCDTPVCAAPRPVSVGKRDLASRIRHVLRKKNQRFPGRTACRAFDVPAGRSWPDREQWRQFDAQRMKAQMAVSSLARGMESCLLDVAQRSGRHSPLLERREKRRHRNLLADPAIHERFGCEHSMTIGKPTPPAPLLSPPCFSVSLVCLRRWREESGLPRRWLDRSWKWLTLVGSLRFSDTTRAGAKKAEPWRRTMLAVRPDTS